MFVSFVFYFGSVFKPQATINHLFLESSVFPGPVAENGCSERVGVRSGICFSILAFLESSLFWDEPLNP